MEKVADASNLYEAWKRVKANKGSGGIDGQAVEEFGRKALPHILEMQKRLLAGQYGRALRLTLKFLKAGLMQNSVCRRREEGTPQGGPFV